MGSSLQLVPKKQLPWVLQMNCYCDYGLSPKPRGFTQSNLMSRLTHLKILLLSETLSGAPSTTCDPHDQLPQRLRKGTNVSMLFTGPHREGPHLLDPKEKGHAYRIQWRMTTATGSHGEGLHLQGPIMTGHVYRTLRGRTCIYRTPCYSPHTSCSQGKVSLNSTSSSLSVVLTQRVSQHQR